MLHVLNPEDLVTKAVGTYLSEKRVLESQLSTGSVDTEDPTPPPPATSVEAVTPPMDAPLSEESCPRLGSEINLSEDLVSKVSMLLIQ